MKTLRSIKGLSLVGPTASREISDGLAPVAVLWVIALVRLAAYAWHPGTWGSEESIALAFALGAGYLLTRYFPEKNRDLGRS
ncbi:MAG TPA: hypothetical protein VGL13_02905 [Polyangiaceae bacterium]|jgi:hypothetical protein